MAGFLGESECRLDSKNRISLPSTFQRQLPLEAQGQLVINRGFEKHLVLYPRNVWDVISKEINQLITDQIGPIAKLDKIQFTEGLPKTRSGKIMRRILRKIACKDTSNLGDISTLLNPEVVQDIMDNAL